MSRETLIEQITEMGFGRDEVIHALDITSNDFDTALNFLIQGPDALASIGPVNSTTAVQKYQPDFVEVPASQSKFESGGRTAPVLPPRNEDHHRLIHETPRNQELLGELGDTATYQHINYVSSDDEDDDEDLEEVKQQQYTSIYENIYRYHKSLTDLPVLMPVKSGFLESYLNPVITVLYQIPALREVIFQHQFKTLGYHPRWFKGEAITVPEDVTHIKKEDKELDLSFLLEVQRLFAFFDGERAFTSVQNFIKSFPIESKKKFQEIDNLHEAYEVFVESLTNQLESVDVHSANSFFQNVATDAESGESRSFSVFNIDAEDIGKDLYHTVHSVLWSDDFEAEQYVSSLADIVTFTFESNYRHSYSASPLSISEEFYPQIYTADFRDIIKELATKRNEIEKERREIAAELMKLRVHNGKHISYALSHSIEFLTNELKQSEGNESLSEALKDITSIQESTNNNKDKLIDKQEELVEAKKQVNIYNIEAILSKSSKEVEPYLLTGIVFSPTQFAYATRSKTLVDDTDVLQWNLVRYKSDGLDDFEVKEVHFEDLRKQVRLSTGKDFQSSMVLIYVLKSRFFEDIKTEIPQSVKDFIERDNEELVKSLELILSSSDEDAQMIYDSDSDSDRLSSEDDSEEKEPDLIELNSGSNTEDKENNGETKEQ